MINFFYSNTFCEIPLKQTNYLKYFKKSNLELVKTEIVDEVLKELKTKNQKFFNKKKQIELFVKLHKRLTLKSCKWATNKIKVYKEKKKTSDIMKNRNSLKSVNDKIILTRNNFNTYEKVKIKGYNGRYNPILSFEKLNRLAN